VEELEPFEAVLVVDADEEVVAQTLWIQVTCLSPDAFDAMRAEADVVQGRALHGLDGHRSRIPDGGA
jgi:hypothetical protein